MSVARCRSWHVMPNNDAHESSRSCWCEPYLDYKDPDSDNEVWVHRELH
jgi:hypothetical protein